MALNIGGDLFGQSDVRETVTNTEISSVGYDLDYAQYGYTFSHGSANTNGLYISPDGLNFYTVDADDDVKQYTMTSKWTLSTATLTHTLDVSAKETDLKGIHFKPDGTKMYTVGANGDSIDEYNLGTAWLLSSAVYAQEFDISGEIVNPRGLWIRDDGRHIYISGIDNDLIQSYFLSTAWDITTAVKLDDIAFVNPTSLFLSKDGVYVFIGDGASLKRYVMTTVFKISTAAADISFDPTPALGNISAVFFKQNGKNMFLMSATGIQEYKIKRGWE